MDVNGCGVSTQSTSVPRKVFARNCLVSFFTTLGGCWLQIVCHRGTTHQQIKSYSCHGQSTDRVTPLRSIYRKFLARNDNAKHKPKHINQIDHLHMHRYTCIEQSGWHPSR